MFKVFRSLKHSKIFVNSLQNHVSRRCFITKIQQEQYKRCAYINKTLFTCNPYANNFIIKRYNHKNFDIETVYYTDIKSLPQHPDKLLIDVREREEIESTGEIPTSINIPLAEVITELGPETNDEEFLDKYGREKPGEEDEIIFTCKSGMRASKAAIAAQKIGFGNVKIYGGSWLDWTEKENL